MRKIDLTQNVITFRDNKLYYPVSTTDDIKIVINEFISDLYLPFLLSDFTITREGKISGYSIIELFELNPDGQIIISDNISIHFLKESENKSLGILPIERKLFQGKNVWIDTKEFANKIVVIERENQRLKNINEKTKKDIDNSPKINDQGDIEEITEEDKEDVNIVDEIRDLDI